MSKHKLVPFEPTPEMVEAAEDAYMPFGDMDLALRMAILAAPAVQGEPVAGLMGVLGQYFDAMDSIGREGTATSTLIAEAECDEAEARLRLFIAAHRKGGEA